MSQILTTQVKLKRTSGITADDVVNTFHHIVATDGDAAAITAAGQVHAALETFYTSIRALLASTLSGTAEVKTYTLAHPQPRAPIDTSTFLYGSPPATAMPGEVAICLSYSAAPVSGVPVARTRGRIYIGPLTTPWMAGVVAGDMRPLAANNTTLRAAAIAFANAPADAEWCVWSPTSLTARPVVSVATDDAFDIQRRRGARPTARTTGSI